ncbi:MAG TPA: MlaD family protein [Solirubrobacteraceae bacterium]|nr:MlaD family protein [Solirubrobacteraceae bacterium]
MKRLAAILVLAAAVAAIVTLGTGASEEKAGSRYWVQLDNAFGLTDGADLKIAGVRAGKVTDMELDRRSMKALIGFEITQTGFDDLRKDVRCETRPQSLIGEYFIDCRPGTSRERLKPGDTIPVEQTETTVPIDLINNIMRRPYRERFSILLSELGAGLAARGPELNETIRRAVPALRQVDRLLAILAEQRRTIRQLYDDAEEVMTAVADDRDEVVRFVQEARDTAEASALEDEGIRRQWATLPTFLRELRPTLAELDATATEQIPALRNLRTASPALRALFETLGPYSDASRPAVRTLADAARRGRRAVSVSRAPVAELRRAVDDLPEAADNLGITLDHLHDPRFAVEKDARAGRGPDGGYTGFEALIRYFFRQSQAINLFDASSYILKASVFLDRPCANYTTAEMVKDGTSPDRCRAWMGPNQPGMTSPDPTAPGAAAGARARRDRDGERDRRGERRGADRDRAGGDRGADGDGAGGGGGAGDGAPHVPGLSPVPDLDDLLDDTLPDVPGAPEVPRVPDVGRGGDAPDSAQDLLDFLVGP